MHHKKSSARELSVCVVTYPLGNASGSYYNLIINLLELFSPLVHKIFLITANFPKKQIENPKVHIINLKYKSKKSLLAKIIPYLIMQMQITYNLVKLRKKINGCVFILSEALLLPTLLAKMLRKEIVLPAFAPTSKRAKYEQTHLYSNVIKIFEWFTLKLANKIVVESPHVATFMGLSNYQNKICSEGCIFINDAIFKPSNKISERENMVGYIGRLSEEKGVLNFVKAIPEIIKRRDDLKFLIVGDGPSRDKLEEFISNENLRDKVKLAGWISHDKIPDFLNELKIVVLASYTEGLPGIVLEAMACGCVVLATSVGGIPDVIKDRETGFILENNSPELIAENVIGVLNYSDLDTILMNARKLIVDKYTYEPLVRAWGKVLNELMTGK